MNFFVSDVAIVGGGPGGSATAMLGTSLRDAQRIDDGWRLGLSNGCQLSTKFVVDATGGSASFARHAGARFVEMVESFADGWWYTAGLPNGKRITCCVTDADLAQRMRLGETSVWQQQLATAGTIAKMTNASKPCGTVAVRSTNSRLLNPVTSENWLAVGDAASRFDPLSS